MTSEARKLVDVNLPPKGLRERAKAFTEFADYLVRKHEQNEREIQRVGAEIKRGARAGKGRFHL